MPTSSNAVDAPRNGERPPFASTPHAIALAAACLVGAILVAYHNSFSGPLIFDDNAAIAGNPSIRHLTQLRDVLSPPSEDGQTVGGRPLVNLSLAINYAIGRTEVRGYHLFNLIVHMLGTLVLFGVVRRTLLQPALRVRFGSAATPLAFAAALLWAVHPLLTESVTYVIQRAESLMGLFYLLTLHCFVRGATKPGVASAAWLGLSCVACLLGMATKEVMVSAPVLVLLYDRTFVTDSWRTAWSRRKYFYAALCATWLPLVWLAAGAKHRGGTAGFGLGDSVWTYALTQTRAITLYLQLAVWPHPLVFDYGTDAIEHLTDAWPFALTVAALIASVVVAWRRWPTAAFLGIWFFAILAPSSSFVPILVQPVAEHRMYLPLAAIVALIVGGLYARWPRGCWLAFVAAALVLAALTVRRNEDFRTAVSIWSDTVTKRPTNARARCYLADALAADGQFAEALTHYDEAIRLDQPALARGDRSIYGDILVNSGNVLRALGRNAEAAKRYEDALHFDASLVAAHFNLGAIHLQANRLPAAIEEFTRALQLDPKFAAAHTSLGSALLLSGRSDDAVRHYEAALQLDPSAKAERDLGVALLYLQRTPEAATHFQRALQLDPGDERARRLLDSIVKSSR